jgi:hypothetical protein
MVRAAADVPADTWSLVSSWAKGTGNLAPWALAVASMYPCDVFSDTWSNRAWMGIWYPIWRSRGRNA